MMTLRNGRREAVGADSLSRSQSGFTLMELLLVIGITGMVLVPVMAWSITALGREANSDIDADTAGYAQVNRFLAPDVARSTSGIAPVPFDQYCGGETDPAPPPGLGETGYDPDVSAAYVNPAVLTLSFGDRNNPTYVSYNQKPADPPTDPATGEKLYELVRRTCTEKKVDSAVTDEEVVAENVVGQVDVSCRPRAKYANSAGADDCGEVAMTLNGRYGDPVTVRATRQVDPVPDPTPGSRPIPVILCTPTCPATVYRGAPVSFDGTLSSDRDPGGVTGYAWNFGDGSAVVPSARAQHSYDTVGTFTVTLTVSNASGGTKPMTATVNVKNATPVAVAFPNPMSAFRNQSVLFDGSRSSDPDGAYGPGMSYLWTFGDGSPSSTDAKPDHTYTGSFIGRRDASLTVNDQEPIGAESSTIAVPVDVKNSLPQFNMSSVPPTSPCEDGNPEAGDCIRISEFPVNVSISALNSQTNLPGAFDVDGNIPPGNFKWDIRRKGASLPYVDPIRLGTGASIAYNGSPGFTFTQNGVYTVTLEVTDNDLGRTIRSVEVVVNNKPVAVASPAKCVINVGQPATCEFSADGSNDADGEIISYEWDWGDGSPVAVYPVADEPPSDPPVDPATILRSHTYDPRPDFGTFNARLTVTDNDLTRTHVDIPIKVNRPPIAVIGPDDLTAYRGKLFDFSGTSSTDPDGDDTTWTGLTYAWNFGDGTTGTGHTPDHIYSTKGLKTVTLTVTDADGGTNTTSRQLMVINQKPVADIYVPTPYINDPSPYTFTPSALPGSYDPDGTITSYVWDFGDGTTATGANPGPHTYPTYGTYDLKLTVTDNDGESTSFTKQMKVNQKPTANFTTNPNPPVALDPPLTVAFDASSSNDPDGDNQWLTYTWDFGDGTTGTGINPTHVYTQRQSFTVTLTVDDGEGGIATKTVVALVGINKLPIAKITPTPAGTETRGQNVKPATWSFDPVGTNDPDGTIATYEWDYGDGSPKVTGAGGTLGVVSHTYTDYGTYTVSLKVTDNLGSTATATIKVKVNQPPTAVIKPDSPNPLLGGRGVPFQFDGLSSNDPDGLISAYLWDFGDGATSTDSRPMHTYTANGTYTVTLLVRDNNIPAYTSSTVSRTIEINNSPPTAKIVSTPAPTGGLSPATAVVNAAPGTVHLDGSQSTDPDGSIVTYEWDFGDGSPVASGQVFDHVFTQYGTYTVKLTVTDDSGLTDVATLRVRINRPPTPVITVVSGEPCANVPPCTVTFSAAGSSDPDGTLTGNIRWVADGATRKAVAWSSGDHTFTYTFTTVGRNTIQLIAQDNDFVSGSVTYDVMINRPPVAGFTTTPNPPVLTTAPYTVAFNGGSPNSSDPDGTIASYAWDFGDGSTATGATPSHTYTDPGTYMASLTVTDNSGVTATIAKVIRVNKVPTADIGPSTLDPKLDLPFQFTGAGSVDPDGTITKYEWDFGDGTTGLGVTPPVHIYTANGNYTVTLTVTDNDGTTNTATRTLTVAPNVDPVASFETDPANGRGDGAPSTIGFDASASQDPDGQIVSYDWDFGDGTTATGENVSHVYTAYGPYTATLTVTDNNGATATTSRPILINQIPIASIQTVPSPALSNNPPPFVVDLFGDLSQDLDGSIAAYDWDFGDGTANGTGSSVSHTYSDYGTYTVTLTVTDNSGGTGTTTTTVKVNRPPVVNATYSPNDVRREAPVSFEATGTYDPDGTIALYQWSFGDGYIGGGPGESGRTATHTYTTMGDFDVTLTVIDNDGGQASYTFTITVGNADPIPEILSIPSPPVIGLNDSIQLFGGTSVDPDGTIVSYEWYFGDEQPGDPATAGASVTHQYSDYGVYPVTLKVTDNNGQSTTSDIMFVTVNKSPIAVIGSTAGLTRGIEFQFTSTGSNDPDGSIVSYQWQFGDGTFATGPSPKKTYGTDKGLGPYTVQLIVIDNHGFQTIAQVEVTLINQNPTAQVSATRVLGGVVSGPPVGPAPLEIEFSGAGSSDPEGAIVSYAWDFGDGQTAPAGPSPTIRHTYTGGFVGTRTATVTVTDKDGGTATKTVNVTINNNQAPTAAFSFTQQSIYGGPVVFDASASSDPDGMIVSYSWDLDTKWNGSDDIQSGMNLTKTLGIGYWNVRLTVTDNSGATASVTHDVWVRGSTAAPVLSYDGNGNFSWTAVPGAVEYKLYSKHTGNCGNDTAYVPAHTLSAHLSGESGLCDFWGNQSYDVWVQARNHGSDEWSVESNKINANW